LINEKKDLIRRIAALECSADQDSQKTHKMHHRIHSDYFTPSKLSYLKLPTHEEILKKSPKHKSSQSYGEYQDLATEVISIPPTNLHQDYKPVSKKLWSPKFSLKSHLDAVRGVKFISDTVLASASEDRLVKLWDLSLLQNESELFEPYLTLRGHSGAVLSISSGEEMLFSADSEGFIRSWTVPSMGDYDPDSPSLNYCLTKWKGHSDSIWSIKYNNPDKSLITCSSDSTVKLWKLPLEYRSGSPVCKTFTYPGLQNNPTVCDWVSSNMNYIVVGYLTFITVYNVETSGFSKIPFIHDSHSTSHQVNCIYTTNKTSLTITGHEDKRIRFFDLSANKCIKDMVGHTDSVTDLCFDQTGFYMLSTGHDGSLRSWDLRNFHCLHEITLNRKKFDESIFGIDLHPTSDVVAIAGSDSVVKILESKSI
jgi:striatin 1/3/4